MTDKKEKILESALTLFAKYGFDATSTSKIAKAASVSEGLIFRHFDTKHGLLNAIMDMGKERAAALYDFAAEITDARHKLKFLIEIPFNFDDEQKLFWTLMHSIKWQVSKYNIAYTEKLRLIIEEAFSEMNYEDPKSEATGLLVLIDGLVSSVLLNKSEQVYEYKDFWLKKYKLI